MTILECKFRFCSCLFFVNDISRLYVYDIIIIRIVVVFWFYLFVKRTTYITIIILSQVHSSCAFCFCNFCCACVWFCVCMFILVVCLFISILFVSFGYFRLYFYILLCYYCCLTLSFSFSFAGRRVDIFYTYTCIIVLIVKHTSMSQI